VSTSRPVGWRASAPTCQEVQFLQKQTLRFNRALGPYRPAVVLWACPNNNGYEYNALEEFPATYLGDRADGTRFFMRKLGESNWPKALDDLRGHLAIIPPRGRHVFELRPSPTP